MAHASTGISIVVITPDALAPDRPGAVTVVAEIRGGAGTAPDRLVLQRIHPDGRLITVGALRDDGWPPDAVKRDGLFTGRVVVRDAVAGEIVFKVSAPPKSALVSATTRVRVRSDASPAPVTVRLEHGIARFVTATGRTTFDLPIADATSTRHLTAEEVGRIARHSVVVSDDGTSAGVFLPVGVSTARERFRYITGDGERWSVKAPAGLEFFRPRDDRVMSADGTRILLVAVAAVNTRPRLFVYDNGGAVVYESPNGLLEMVYEAGLSFDGRYLFAHGVRGSSPPFEDVVLVVHIARHEVSVLRVDETTPLDIRRAPDGRFAVHASGTVTVLPSRP